jgi:hypothetical protein
MSGATGQGPSDTLLSGGVLILIAGLLLIALLLAAAAAPLVRRYYGRRVRRLMGLDQVAPRPVGNRSEEAAQSSGALPSMPFSQSGAEGWTAVARQRQQRIIRATLSAWLTFTVTALLTAGVDPKAGLGDRLLFFVVTGVLALVPALTNLPEGWTQWSLADVFPGLAIQVTLGQLTGQSLWQRMPQSVANGGTFLALWYRRLRGQVLPVFVVLGCWVVLLFGIYAYWEPRGGDAWLTHFSEAKEGSAIFTSAQLIVPLVWVLFLWLGFRLLDGVAWLIRRGWASELSPGSAVSLMVIAVVMVASADERHGFWPACATLLWVAATVGVYLLALGRSQGDKAGPQLLVLRVFSEDPTRQILLDELQDHCRYVGPVQQIAGFDMVDLNVDPYEASMFLSNRMHELFLPVGPSPAQLKAHLRTAPDHEGRYPIDEVFCFNTAWRDTVNQLMHLSDAIVLDVRGLTAQREGTGYEIGLLARDAALAKVVTVADDSTDWAHVESLVRAQGADPAGLMRLSIGKEPQSQELFTKLLHAAARPASA